MKTPTKSKMIQQIGKIIGVKLLCACCQEKLTDSIVQVQNQVEQTFAGEMKSIQEIKKHQSKYN